MTLDLLIVGDLTRTPLTPEDLADAILAAASAGWAVGLLQVDRVDPSGSTPLRPDVAGCVQAGLARMVPTDAPGPARLVVFCDPGAAAHFAPTLRTEHTLVEVPDWYVHELKSRGQSLAAALRAVVTQAPGDRVVCAPTGWRSRAALESLEGEMEIDLAWGAPVVDVDTRLAAARTVRGRPRRAGLVLDAPTLADHAPALRVLALAGMAAEVCADPQALAEALLPSKPPREWRVNDPASTDVGRLLDRVDVFVAVGGGTPAVLAAASGVPVVVTESAVADEPLGSSVSPREVVGRVAEVRGDRLAAAAAASAVRRHFGLEARRAALERRLGPPSSTPAAVAAAPRRRRDAPSARVLFVTSNGTGMGHVTRMMACARRLPADVEPVFATLSLALDPVRQQGYLCEYIPRPHTWKSATFNPFLRRRLGELVTQYRPSALVFDGTFPYQGLVRAREDSGIPFAWMRRPMWQEGRGELSLRRGQVFDMVVEPGELAAAEDRGLTTSLRDEAVCVAPVTYLDHGEAVSREQARAELGLDPTALCVLLMLGSYRTGDTDASSAVALRRLLAWPTTEIAFAGSMMREARATLPERVKHLSTYPLARYFRAFDFAIGGAGYNGFHELMRWQVPTAFVPQAMKTDDQPARARWAEAVGAGLHVSSFGDAELDRCLAVMRDPRAREAMRERMEDLDLPNGAQEAADAIAFLAREGRPAKARPRAVA